MPENIKGVGSKDYTSLKLDLENKERKAETNIPNTLEQSHPKNQDIPDFIQNAR